MFVPHTTTHLFGVNDEDGVGPLRLGFGLPTQPAVYPRRRVSADGVLSGVRGYAAARRPVLPPRREVGSAERRRGRRRGRCRGRKGDRQPGFGRSGKHHGIFSVINRPSSSRLSHPLAPR